ncbi:hypothetical protein [Halobacterium yunchengense]|uniref:hypothetical protein n=1 Tax=Halobacterium yunchengense TaxID=3108497 RepID=UPI00300AB7E7
MSHSGAPGPGDPGPTQCVADGPLEPGRSAVEAVECDSARFVAMAHASGGIQPTYLVLTAADGEPTQLEVTDVLSVPEVQNALAYFGEHTDSVRVRTRAERRVAVEEHVRALRNREDGEVLQFGGCTFDLDVVVG